MHNGNRFICNDPDMSAALCALLEQEGFALCGLAPDRTVRWWSDGMSQLSGVAPAQAVSRPVAEAWPDVADSVFVDSWILALDRAAPASLVAALRARGEAERTLESRAVPMTDGVLIALRDVTHSSPVETGTDAGLRALLEADLDPVLLLDEDRRIVDANAAAVRLLGSSVAGLERRAVGEVLAGLDGAAFAAAAETQDPDASPIVRLCQAGETPREFRAALFDIELGPARRRVLRLRDVTRERQSEEALWQANERFHALVEGAPDLIFVIDDALRFLFVNRYSLDRLGLHAETTIGRTVAEVFGRSMGEALREAHGTLRETGRSVECEAPVAAAGRSIWFHTVLVPIRDSAGGIAAAAGISRDLSDARRMHEEVVESERLSIAQQMAGAVSHEFSQPLQALRLMADGVLAGGQPEHARDLRRVIERLEALVDRVKRLSRVETKPYGRNRIVDFERSASAEEAPARRVLIVDDEELIRELLGAVIGQFGFAVDTAADGRQGLARLRETRYGLVLCDIAMPVLNGIELFRQARREFSGVPFVLMSGYAVNDEDHRAIELADGYLQKPFTVDRVRDVLVRVFGEADVPTCADVGRE